MKLQVALEEDDILSFTNEINNVSLEDITDNVLFNTFRGIKVACEDLSVIHKLQASLEAYDNYKNDSYYKTMHGIIINKFKTEYDIDDISIEDADYKSEKQIALEGLGDILKKIWEAIKNVFVKIYNAIKKFFIGEKQEEIKINKDLDKQIEKIKNIKKKRRSSKTAKVSKLFKEYSSRNLKVNPKDMTTEIITVNSDSNKTEEVINVDLSTIQINPQDLEDFRYLNNDLNITFLNSHITRLSNYQHLVEMLNKVLNAHVDNLDGAIETYGHQKSKVSLDENIKSLYNETCNRMTAFIYEIAQALQEVPVQTEDLKFIPEPRRNSTIATLPYLDNGDMIYIFGQDDPDERKKPYYLMFLIGNTTTSTDTDKVTAPLLDYDDLLNFLNSLLRLQSSVDKTNEELYKTNKLCDVLKDRIDRVKLYDTEGSQNSETLEVFNKTLDNISQFYKIFYYYFQNATKLNKRISNCVNDLKKLSEINIYHYNKIDEYIIEE